MFSEQLFVYSAVMRSYTRVSHRLIAGLLLLVPSLSLHAQTTEADLRARLLNKPFFLRNQWANDKLTFDAIGNLQGDPKRIAFALSGAEISAVKLTPRELIVTGKRMGVIFTTSAPMRVPLDNITIRVTRPDDGDFTAALDAIFADNISQIVPQIPKYWQRYLTAHFPTAGAHQDLLPPPNPVHHTGGVVSAPTVIKHVPPELNNVARNLGFSGVSTVTCVVDETGAPIDVAVLRPVGLGLDDIAVASVLTYVFKPATEDGKPIRVRVNVEVNFQAGHYP